MAGLAIGENAGNPFTQAGRTALEALKERAGENGAAPGAGGDEIALSPRALGAGAEAAGEEGQSEGGSGQVEEGGPLLRGQANGFLHKALNGIKSDVGQLLKGFGYGGEVANSFAKSFVSPVLDALKAGVSFTAELSFAAFSQVTQVSGDSYSQSTALVAKSLSIEVNQETGAVAVSLASLSYQEEIRAVSGDGPAPLLTLGPGPIAPPVPKDREEEPIEALPPEEAESETDEVAGTGDAIETEEALPIEEEEPPLAALLRDLQERLSFEAVTFQSILAIRSIEFTRNAQDEPVTRIELDAELPLEELARIRPDEETETLDVTV